MARPPLARSVREALELAVATPGYFPAERLRALAEMAAAGLLDCQGPILELGSYCGRSTVVLGALAKIHGQELVTVDTHLGSVEMLPPFPYLDQRAIERVHGRLDSLGPLMDSLELAGLRTSVTVIVGRTQALRNLLAPGFAIVLIDGGHDLKTATSDVECALALASPAGRIIMDDIFTDPRAGGQAPRIAMELALARGWRIVDEEGPLVALAR